MNQKIIFSFLLSAVCLPVFFGISGCDSVSGLQGGDPKEKGEQALAAKDYGKAVRFYEEALDGTQKTADIHYRLAIIYDNYLKTSKGTKSADYLISAIHHYKRFLALAPATKRKDEVEKSMDRLNRELAIRLGDEGLVSKAEAIRIRNENEALKKQISFFREDRNSQKQKTGKPPTDSKGFSKVPQTRAAETVVGPDTRTYTVKKGDTLGSIAKKFYNSKDRWKDIEDANHNQLQGSTNLREGQVLIIP